MFWAEISAQNIDCGYSLEPPRQNIDCGYSLEQPRRGGSNEYPQSMFWAEIWKISYFFISEFFHFLVGKLSVYLNRHVSIIFLISPSSGALERRCLVIVAFPGYLLLYCTVIRSQTVFSNIIITLQTLYNTVRYNTVLAITRFKDGSQKYIDYIEKWPCMVIFQYNLNIFVWI